jgi:parallel beta-helix repeat protein
MRTFLLTVLLFLCAIGNATNYYFSSSTGDDSRTAAQAQNPATPWKSIQKLNAVFPTLSPGDSVLLKRGDVFEGKLVVAKSGTAANPIVVAAYGSGSKPVISGLMSLKNFSLYSGNVWVHELNTNQSNILLLNEKQQPLGRYPNADDANGGFLNFETHATTTSITDNDLSPAVDWTGAELVLRKRRWIIDRCKITSQSGGTLAYANATTYEPINGFGYFIQNHIKALDKNGEWSFDAAQKKLYLYQSHFSAASTDVKVSVTDTLLYLNFQNYITLKDLQFKGANETAVIITNARNITLSNCEILYTGANAVLLNNACSIVVENSVFNYSNNNAINTLYNCRDLSFRNNTISNTGIYPGMGKSGDLTYQAITVKGKNCVVEDNKIDSTGYVPIRFEGDSVVVKNNVITNFLWLKDDGGGIYTWNNGTNATDNVYRVIKDNVILNGIGAGAGTSTPGEAHAHGIYLDDNSANVEISGNTVTACGESGLYIHNSHNVAVTGNTFYNNARQVYMQHDNNSPTKPIRNISLKGNILYAKDASQFLVYMKTIADDIALFGTSDNNYFCSPFQTKPSIYTAYTRNNYEFVQTYDLSSWQGALKMDLSSKPAPAQLPPYQNKGLLGSGKTVSPATFDKDIKGVYSYVYAGAFKIEWNNGGKLDGGCLQMTMDTATNNRGYAIMDVGSVAAGKTYILKFSLLGKSNNKSLSVFLRKTGSPYTRISDVAYGKVLSTRTENEFLFIPKETVAGASLLFDVSDQNTLWMDNVSFAEANVSLSNPDNYIRFDYNDAAAGKTVGLDANYIDAKSVAYAGSISLVPFSSTVLLKTGATIAKAAQTITFPAIPNKTVDDAFFTLNATASSGLPVSYRVTAGPATVSGNAVTLTGVGTVRIEASQEGNAAFNAAPVVTQSFDIVATAVKQNQNISFPTIASKTLGDASFSLTASATSGLPVSYRIVSGLAIISGNMVTITGAGTVTIEASQAGDSNFNAASPVTQSFTVVTPSFAKQAQTISFGSLGYKTYNSPAFDLTATASSGLPVIYRVVSGPVTISGSRVTTTGVGQITIEAYQSGNARYNPAIPVRRSFTVGKASQAITFPAIANKSYGSSPFTLTASASSGLPVSYRVVSGPAQVSGSTVTLTGSGTVTIEASQSGNSNYAAANKLTRSFMVTRTIISAAATDNKGVAAVVENSWQDERSNSLQVYPNPLSANGTIAITLMQSVTATVAVFDLQGRLMKNFGERPFTKGQSVTINLDAQTLPGGMYLVRLTAQSLALTQRFIVVK